MVDLDERLIEDACIYAWALVPSFYLYSFFDTTKNYLQSEGAIFAPIVISFFCTVLHIFIAYAFIVNLEMGYIGAAWAKNISDCVNSLALYLYIVWKQPTVDSWV